LKCWIFDVKSIEIEQKRMSEEKKKQGTPAKKSFSILDGASEKTSKTANSGVHETDDGGHQHGFVDQENSDYDSYGSGKKSHTRGGDSDIEF
jgi:hypothetical protein